MMLLCNRNTRAPVNQIIKTNFIPRNSKHSRLFIVRAVKSFNALPLEIKQLHGKDFNDEVKKYYYEKENQELISCNIN